MLIGFALAISCLTSSAQSTDSATPPWTEEAGERLPLGTNVWSLGTKYFEEICLPSLGRPTELRRLAKSAGLRPLSAAQFEKVKAPNGLEGWVRGGGPDYVIVEYSARKNVGCSIYMSSATEANIRQYMSRIAGDFTRKGSTAKLVHDDLVDSRGPTPFRVLQYEITSEETGVSALGALVSEQPIRGRQGALILLSKEKPEDSGIAQAAAASPKAQPKPVPGCPDWQTTLQGEGFPKAAERAGLTEGTATVEFLLRPDGAVVQPTIVKSSNQLFDSELLERATRMKCVGAEQPVRVQFSVIFRVQ